MGELVSTPIFFGGRLGWCKLPINSCYSISPCLFFDATHRTTTISDKNTLIVYYNIIILSRYSSPPCSSEFWDHNTPYHQAAEAEVRQLFPSRRATNYYVPDIDSAQKAGWSVVDAR